MTFQAKPSYLPDDVRAYAAPRPRMDLFWAFLAACLALVAYVEPNDAAPQDHSLKGDEWAASLVHPPAVAAPYAPCPKLSKGRWLRAEIAQQVRDGWRIACVYDGDQLMTRDEAQL